MSERPVALVTGASRGIGRAVALELARVGYHVIINYLSDEGSAKDVLSAIRHAGSDGELCRFDVADRAESGPAIDAILERHPVIAVLVNNAGVTADGLLATMPPDDWDRVINTSLLGFYNVTRPVLSRAMVPARRGSIVTVSSVSGLTGNRGQTNYSAAKAGLVAASRALAKEVGRLRIRVNVVAPGLIDTDMTAAVPGAALRKMIPMARMGRPEEVATVVRFLCSDDASYVTGAVVPVHGGLV